MTLTDFKCGDRVRHARGLATGTVQGFRLGAFVCVRWDDGTEGDYYPRGLRPHEDNTPPIDLSKVPKGHLVIPHADFDAAMLSNDCRHYFIDGFGMLEVRGNTNDGVVLEYYDHCGDGTLMPEWDRSKPPPSSDDA